MNDVQENKLSMYLAVESVVNTNNPVWSGVPAFASAVGAFALKLEGIVGVVERQETAITGVRSDKLNAQNLMIETALTVSGSVFAYASTVNNQTLKEAVSYTESSLKYVRDTISAERCTVIHSQASAVVADLGDYGVTPAVLAELDDRITAFIELIAAPRVAITSRKGATSVLVELIKEMDLILKEQLDMLMPQFKVSDPVFYTHYFDSRLIAGARRNHAGDADNSTNPAEPSTGG